MNTVTKITAMALMLGLATPAFATVDQDATATNPMVNQKDTIKGDTSPHANAPKSVEPKTRMDVAPEHREMMRPMHGEHMKPMSPERKANHEARMEKMKNMTPAQREAARKKWEMKRAEWEKMTPEQREAAKAKWEANKMDHKDLNKEDRQGNINGGVAAEKNAVPAIQ